MGPVIRSIVFFPDARHAETVFVSVAEFRYLSLSLSSEEMTAPAPPPGPYSGKSTLALV